MPEQNEQHFQIADKMFWHQIKKEFGRQGGVYCLFSQMDNKRVAINRILSKDNGGFLYIGKANVFLERVIELKKSLSPDHNSSGHDAGVRWKENKGIMASFPYKSLYVRLVQSENPELIESRLLEKYEEKFGELPPLNWVS